MVVVAPGGKKASWSATGDANDLREIDVTPAPRGLDQSVSQREFRTLPQNLPSITGPEDASRYAHELGGEGILLTNNRNQPVSWIPMAPEDMAKLKDNMQGDILREAHKRNANQAFLFGTDDVALENTGNFLNTAGIAPIDVFGKDRTSWRTANKRFSAGGGGWTGLNEWGQIDPKMLGPLAAAGAAGMYANDSEASPEQIDSFNTDSFLQGYHKPVADDWRARRAGKRKDPNALEYAEAAALMGGSILGGIGGGLTELVGNAGLPSLFFTPEEVGSAADSVRGAMTWNPSPGAAQALQPVGNAVQGLQEGVIDPVVRQYDNRAPWIREGYNQLPPRIKGIMSGASDFFL
jgi:hypothetical protein